MFQKFVAISLLALLTFNTACGKKDDDKGDKKKDTDQVQLQDVTDKSMCKGGPAPGASIFNQAFRLVEKADNQVITTTFFFTRNRVDINVSCLVQGIEAQVQASANARVDGNSLEILSNDEKKTEVTVGGTTVTCTASISRSPLMNYNFQGTCLQIATPGAAPVVIPPAL